MYSLIRNSLAATAVLSMAHGVVAHPTALHIRGGNPQQQQQQQQQQQNNKIERPEPVKKGGGGGGVGVGGAGAIRLGAESGPGVVGAPKAKILNNAKALYFLTNDEENAVAAVEVGADGLITGNGAVHKTGGKGANGIDGATNEKAVPDALFSQSALTVAGKYIFAVNAGSNTLSMFEIDPENPLALEKIGQDLQLPGEFPNTVAASEKNGLVCVGMTGQKAGVACADFDPEAGLGQVDQLREFQLNQTTPPVGPTNTVSHVFWSDDESQLLATVKGDPEQGNTGFLSAYAVLETDVVIGGAEGAPDGFVENNNGFNNRNGSEVAFGNQNQNQNQTLGQGNQNQYENQNQNLNQNQNQNLGQANAEKVKEDAKQLQNIYNNINNQYNKNKNITEPIAADGFVNTTQPNQGGKQQFQPPLNNTGGQGQGQANLGNQGNQEAQQGKGKGKGKYYVSQEAVRSSPDGTAVLFGSAAIPWSDDILVTDASFGAAVLSPEAANQNLNQSLYQQQQQEAEYKVASRLELPGQKATCWAAISPLTNTAFVTDVGRNKIIEVGGLPVDVDGFDLGNILKDLGNLDFGNLDLGNISFDEILKDLNLQDINFDQILKDLNLENFNFEDLFKDINFDEILKDLGLENLDLENLNFEDLFKDFNFQDLDFEKLFKDLNVEFDKILKDINLENLDYDKLLKDLNLDNLDFDKLLKDFNAEFDKILKDLNLDNLNLDKLNKDLNLDNLDLGNLNFDDLLKDINFDDILKDLDFDEIFKDLNLGDLDLGNVDFDKILKDLGLDKLDLANLDLANLNIDELLKDFNFTDIFKDLNAEELANLTNLKPEDLAKIEAESKKAAEKAFAEFQKAFGEAGNAGKDKKAKNKKKAELCILNEIDLSAVGGADVGLIDLRAAGEYVYALSPGNGEAGGADDQAAINVIHAGSKKFVQHARLAGVGAGKNSMGMAVYVPAY